ncbi:hypothetical protein V6N13_140157 [Hibiscus sabdariffa]
MSPEKMGSALSLIDGQVSKQQLIEREVVGHLRTHTLHTVFITSVRTAINSSKINIFAGRFQTWTFVTVGDVLEPLETFLSTFCSSGAVGIGTRASGIGTPCKKKLAVVQLKLMPLQTVGAVPVLYLGYRYGPLSTGTLHEYRYWP